MALETLAEVEKRHILRVLEHHSGHRSKTAETLGISLRKLGMRLKEWKMINPPRR